MAQNWGLVSTVLVLLSLATGAGQWLRRQDRAAIDPRIVEAFNARVNAWWFFTVVIAAAFLAPGLTVLMFGLLSFWALREFVTLAPTRSADHRALFWVFFFFTPAQFLLIWCCRWYDLYGLFSVFIPVYGFAFLVTRSAMSGDYDRFLERVAKVQAGLLLCVYSLSYAPALLYLPTRDETGPFDPARLLFYFVTMALAADLLQHGWSRIYGRRLVAEKIDPQLSWEGVLAGSASTAAVGLALAWAAPFPHWWQTAASSFLIALLAAAGSLVVAAVKKDRGDLAEEAYVDSLGGVLSHVDSLALAAPVFYHVARYCYVDGN